MKLLWHDRELTPGQHSLDSPSDCRPRGRGAQCEGQADSPWRAAGRPPARAGWVAGQAPRSRLQGGCTHSGRRAALRPPASPAPCSAGCSASPSTRWSPGRCPTCCPLGRTKARLRAGTQSDAPQPMGSTQTCSPPARTLLLQNKDMVVSPDHVSSEHASFCTINYRAVRGLTAPPGGGPGSPPHCLTPGGAAAGHTGPGGAPHSPHRQGSCFHPGLDGDLTQHPTWP